MIPLTRREQGRDPRDVEPPLRHDEPVLRCVDQHEVRVIDRVEQPGRGTRDKARGRPGEQRGVREVTDEAGANSEQPLLRESGCLHQDGGVKGLHAAELFRGESEVVSGGNLVAASRRPSEMNTGDVLAHITLWLRKVNYE